MTADGYSREKRLDMPAGILETMHQLRSGVAAYRDKQITHFQNPRAFRGTYITREGATQIGTSMLYPKEADRSATSPTVDEVANLIETYIGEVLQLVESNRGKTRYNLRERQ